MTEPTQRFCPVCGRAFDDAEAVIECTGCGVVHHPDCWVRNGGCATRGEHEGEPLPKAFAAPPPPAAAPTGTPATPPSRPPRPSAEPLDTSRLRLEERRPPAADDVPAIGSPGPPVVPAEPSAAQTATRPRAAPPARRLRDAGQLGAPTQRLPRIYTAPGLLRFWYVPVGILLAAVAAFAVILAFDRFTGDGDGDTAAVPDETPTATPTQAASGGEPTATSVPEATPSATATVTAEPARFASGDQATVEGTGSCLNIRSDASLDAQVIDCIADGTTVTVISGPQLADEITWWRVDAPNVSGWAADIYLVTP